MSLDIINDYFSYISIDVSGAVRYGSDPREAFLNHPFHIFSFTPVIEAEILRIISDVVKSQSGN